MTEKKENKPTLEEILAQRGNELTPEEKPKKGYDTEMARPMGIVVTETDASNPKKMGETKTVFSQIAPDAIPENMKSNLKTTTNDQYPTETGTIPASSPVPQPVTGDSIPESQELTPQNEQEFHPTGDIPIPELNDPEFKVIHKYDVGVIGCQKEELTPQGEENWATFARICEKCGKGITGPNLPLICDCDKDLQKDIKEYGQKRLDAIHNGTPQTTDKNLRRLIEFVNGPEFSVDWVRLHLGHISRIPNVIPSITMWDRISFEQVVGAVYATMRAPGYVESKWPTLKIVMGNSRDNREWSVGVLCTMALFDTIKFLPSMI